MELKVVRMAISFSEGLQSFFVPSYRVFTQLIQIFQLVVQFQVGCCCTLPNFRVKWVNQSLKAELDQQKAQIELVLQRIAQLEQK